MFESFRATGAVGYVRCHLRTSPALVGSGMAYLHFLGSLPADPEVDLNTDMARNDHNYQLGRRVNPPRRILEQVLSKIGATLIWETRDALTYLVMRVPMGFVQNTN